MMWLTSKAIGLKSCVQVQATYHKIVGKAWELRIRIAFQLIQLRLFTRRRWRLHHGRWCRRGCRCSVVAPVATVTIACGIVKHQFGQTACNIFTRRHYMFVYLLFVAPNCSSNKRLHVCVHVYVHMCMYAFVCVYLLLLPLCARVIVAFLFLPLSNLHDDGVGNDVNVPGPVSIFCLSAIILLLVDRMSTSSNVCMYMQNFLCQWHSCHLSAFHPTHSFWKRVVVVPGTTLSSAADVFLINS